MQDEDHRQRRDDRRTAIQVHRTAHRRGIAPETRLPQSVTENGHPLAARRTVNRAERAAESVPLDKLPENYAKVIGEADSGTVVPIFTIPAGGREQFVVPQFWQGHPVPESYLSSEMNSRLP